MYEWIVYLETHLGKHQPFPSSRHRLSSGSIREFKINLIAASGNNGEMTFLAISGSLVSLSLMKSIGCLKL